MINSITEAISAAVNAEFGDDYTIYTEAVEQGLTEPCFFVLCVSSSNRVFIGKKYFRENGFCVQYLPQNKDAPLEECRAVAERLYSALEYVSLDGDLTRGTKMNYQITDGVLSFFVNYDMFVFYKTAETDSMEGFAQNASVKE